ncbi:2-octaprenyl-6-methoxyphenyl hydroxylase [Methylococcus sp. EFPC2]|uniref:2-octaprenyl-6-methoxyphenyl hydroxylase n=1 Tax=Methylococcus sp. EFPC2 TaxID=2812648 RepID=UPI001967A4DC|nr:2-octaprenyl-6-methoxyphenyl hydroxylase [Methylococcus sp. EFPC2]QSA96679.1 2-octaprenyl-6-methoxyphenyl hydroxylase [Methylococcus sp. EFPC2]
MSGDFDLLIAGGGLVGGSLALALRNTGLRIGIVESQPEAQRLAAPAGERALALSWGSVQILEQLGIWRGAAEQATPITRIHVSDRGHFGKTRLSADRVDMPALGYVVRAKVLEAEIARLLQEGPVEWLCPARVVGVKAGPDAAHVSLNRNGISDTRSARLLVAADGGLSTVRSLLEIPQTVRDYGQTALVTEVATERNNRGVAYERFTRSGPLAFLPVGKRRCSVVWSLAPEEAEALRVEPEQAFIARLQAAFGYWLGELSPLTPRQCFPLKLVRAGRMVDERVVLIGNAMHQLHPVAGQGFNLGLRDVAVLAGHVDAQLGFAADIGDREFLDRYAGARRSDLDAVIRMTDSLVRVFSTEGAWAAGLRNAGMLVLDNLPAAKRLLMSYAMGRGQGVPRVG